MIACELKRIFFPFDKIIYADCIFIEYTLGETNEANRKIYECWWQTDIQTDKLNGYEAVKRKREEKEGTFIYT